MGLDDMAVSGDTTTCSDGLKPSLRKPYVLTKQREAWSVEEHQEFLTAIQLFNRDWKKIETHIGTKTVVQIRSHAQKWFQKTLKSGNGESVPPPRPKRKTSEVAYAVSGLSDSKLFSKSASDGTYVMLEGASGGGRGELKTKKHRNKTNKDSGCSSPTDAGVSSRSLTPSTKQQQPSTKQQQKHQKLGQKQEAKLSLLPGTVAEQQALLTDPPNLSIVYSYLGSLFDPKFEGCDFAQALHSMQASDRLLSVELMDSLSQRLSAKCRLRDINDPGGTRVGDQYPSMDKPAGRQTVTRRGKRQGSGEGGSSPRRIGRSGSRANKSEPTFDDSESVRGRIGKASRVYVKKELSSSLESVGVDMGPMGLEMEREFAMFEAGMSGTMPVCQDGGMMMQGGTQQWDCGPDLQFDGSMAGMVGMTQDMGMMADLSQLYCKEELVDLPSTMQRSFSGGCSTSNSSGCSSGSTSSGCTSQGGGQQDGSGNVNSEPTKTTDASGGSTVGQQRNTSGDPGSESPPFGLHITT